MPISQTAAAAMREAGRSFVKLEDLQNAISWKLSPLFGSERVRIVSSAHAALVITAAVMIAGADKYLLSQLPESARNNTICLLPEDERIPVFPIQLTGCCIARKKPCAGERLIVSEQMYKEGQEDVQTVVFCDQPVSVDRLRFLTNTADAVIIDGKTLGGPLQSAYIASKAALDDGLLLISAPRHGIARSFKTGKEEIGGAFAAATEFFGGEL